MDKRLIAWGAAWTILLLPTSFSFSQGNLTGGRPPASVVVSKVRSGLVAPQAEFVGTVYYAEVSDVAAESTGKIEAVAFEEGRRVERGDILVKLNADLLQKRLRETIASHEEVLANLEKTRSDLTRIENLFKKQVIPEQLYDETRFRVQSLEKRAASLLAEVERLKIELQRTTIQAPLKGVVLKRHVDQGEWVQPGSVVATLARDNPIDIVVDVPESVLTFLKPGMQVRVKMMKAETKGKIFAVLPRGDATTRTFPVKVKMENPSSYVEGMEARVTLPTDEKKQVFLVPREAVITLFGQPTVFVIIESKAKMVPVTVTAYEEGAVAIEGPGLASGMAVVVKGNERLIEGQVVTVVGGSK